ncbi:glycosyltransferase [Mycoplasma sp. CSL10137]|uniref:glycosyltransferase n=1 Tax=unclassified Mycoplasma TaxID=2683645 RepID=UPI00197B526C|nr:MULTISPECIES: glycosyltransferase [unclassified Mycoplasma]MBN4083565.1 glycosyltransferase [Mycoplasma sp. CSL10137]MBN4084504.1 glycosyltransferase [Mycoplasma sp. CSL10166]MBU4692983.1 glycosyltransferase [Mycoplasma sp. CSL7491-lung]
MKLSIVSLVGDLFKDIEWFLKDLKDQDNQDFEIILFINKKQINILESLKEYFLLFGSRLKVVFNNKVDSYQLNLTSAFKIARGDFLVVINSENTLRKKYVSNIINEAEKYSADILEFKPRLIGSIRWKPKARLKLINKVDINKMQSTYAYTFPFIFNKVYKKNLYKKLVKYMPSNLNDTKMCVELNYILFSEAKTYMYLDYRVYREFINSNTWFNSRHVLDSFNIVENYFKENNPKILEEINYAKIYTIKLLLTGFLNETTFTYKRIYKYEKEQIQEKRSLTFVKRHYELIDKLESNAIKNDFFKSNIYLASDNDESKLLKKPLYKIKKMKILDFLE